MLGHVAYSTFSGAWLIPILFIIGGPLLIVAGIVLPSPGLLLLGVLVIVVGVFIILMLFKLFIDPDVRPPNPPRVRGPSAPPPPAPSPRAVHCPHCGARVFAGRAYCPHCSAPVR